MNKKSTFIFLFFISAAALLLAQGCAQRAPKPSAPQEPAKPFVKGPTEKTYAEDFDRVWEKVIEVLTEKGLSEHPHGKMSANKASGTITTPIFRYFKIFSAKPVQEIDYRDSYTITLLSEAKTKADEAKAKTEEAEGKAEEAKGKTGEEAKILLEESKKAAAEAQTAVEEAKAAGAKPKSVKLQIKRKFEMYDNVKKSWVESDPTKEKVGFTEEALLSAIDAKMAAATPAGATPNAIPPPNLNMTPPLFTEGR